MDKSRKHLGHTIGFWKARWTAGTSLTCHLILEPSITHLTEKSCRKSGGIKEERGWFREKKKRRKGRFVWLYISWRELSRRGWHLSCPKKRREKVVSSTKVERLAAWGVEKERRERPDEPLAERSRNSNQNRDRPFLNLIRPIPFPILPQATVCPLFFPLVFSLSQIILHSFFFWPLHVRNVREHESRDALFALGLGMVLFLKELYMAFCEGAVGLWCRACIFVLHEISVLAWK